MREISCPEELYNLTQLAEVAVSREIPRYEHKLFDRIPSTRRPTNSNGLANQSRDCPDCGRRYSTASNLARHRQTHRSSTPSRRCQHCGKPYSSMPALSMHLRTHSRSCECRYCGKRFSRPWLLQGHIRTHTGEKPFKCSICSKAFADKSNLRAHIQTHSNTKPHVCVRCGKAFALKSYLYKHEEASCMKIHASPEHSSSDGQDLPMDFSKTAFSINSSISV